MIAYGWSYLVKTFVPVISITILLPVLLFLSPSCSRQVSDGGVDNPSDSMTQETTQNPTTGLPDPDSEVRGMWIATVTNINFPSKQGLSAAKLRAELDDIIATAVSANLNAIYFQVRPSADALYKSDIFPTSAYLTGKQGSAVDGDFDVLAYLLEKAHEKNILVHAWVNPLRVTTGTAAKPNTDVGALAENHPARKNPDWVIAYDDGKLYFDAGRPQVRELIAAGVKEIVSKYDVDGVIFDDYFYPYPTSITVNGQSTTAPFADSQTFAQFGGAFSSLGDWRRDNINKMVEGCYKAIKEADPDCLFGIAPFGIWQNNDGNNGGSDTKGLSSYSAIYCDSLAWIKGGYIDYIAPQIYWQFSTEVARYDVLVRWWNSKLEGTNVDLLICHGVYRYDEDWKNPEGEIKKQIEFARSEKHYRGSIMYGYKQIKENSHGLADELREAYKKEIVYTASVSNGQALMLSSPGGGSTVNSKKTYIIGASDPTYPLFYEGQPVGRTKSGYFSLYTDLNEGKNTLEFLYNGETVKHVIYCSLPGGQAYQTMSSYAIKNPYPSSEVMQAQGSSLDVSCTAPSGSTVVATLNGTRITLSPQINPPSNSKYMAETYKGTFTLPAAPSGSITNIGKVSFKAVKGSESATATGAEILVMGEGAAFPVEVIGDYTELKTDTGSWFYEDYTPQAAGMRDLAVQKINGFYKLRMGGYVAVDSVRLLDAGTMNTAAQISGAYMTSDAKTTKIYIKTGENVPLSGDVQDENFVLRVFNVALDNVPVPDTAANPLIVSSEVSGDMENGCAVYAFKLVSPDNFYGFEFFYENGYSVVSLRNPQSLSDANAPLSGKVIIVDAGHGGTDTGATGPLGIGENAVNEADLNLTIARMTAEKLSALGAQVIMTRDEDVFVTLDARMKMLNEICPDLSVSIHQNSMTFDNDITKIRGTIGLYFAKSGRLLTTHVSKTVSDALSRYEFTPRSQWLAMCRNPKFPSTLIEVGFMTSVEEYEAIMNEPVKDTSAQAIVDGIVNYYADQQKWLG